MSDLSTQLLLKELLAEVSRGADALEQIYAELRDLNEREESQTKDAED